MVLDNVTVLENLKVQKAEMEQQLEGGREMYLKICGAIDVLEQIEAANQEDTATETEE